MKKIFCLSLILLGLFIGANAQKTYVQVTVIPPNVGFKDTIQYIDADLINYADTSHGITTMYCGIFTTPTYRKDNIRQTLDQLVAAMNADEIKAVKVTEITDANAVRKVSVLNHSFFKGLCARMSVNPALAKAFISYRKYSGVEKIWVTDTVSTLNNVKKSSIPIWTTATRPTGLKAGIIGWNTDSTKIDVYNGTIWKDH